MAPQTETARADMRIARKYIEEFYEAKKGNVERLSFALKYIAQARQKDPSATLEVKTRKGAVGLETIDGLEAEVYFLHANSIDTAGAYPQERQQAISLYQRSIQLEPLIYTTYAQLAYAYIHNYERKKALALLQNALQRSPDDFDLRSALDTIESKPNWGIKEPNFRPLVISTGLLFLVGGCSAYLYNDAHTFPHQSDMNPFAFLMTGLVIAASSIVVIVFGLSLPRPPR